MGNKIVFEIGVQHASDLGSKSHSAGQQAGKEFQKGFDASQPVGSATRKYLQGLTPAALNRVLAGDKGLRDALAAEYMGAFSGAGKATYASAGGQEFPIEKHAQKFGAATRQMNQAMSELRPSLASMRREWKQLEEALGGQKFQFPHTGGKYPFSPGLESEKLLQQGVKRALGMGALRTGSSIILPSDKMLSAGAKSLLSMGELQTQQLDIKKLMYGLATAPFSPWVAAREIAGSGVFGGGGGGGRGRGFGIWGAAGFEGFMKSFLLLQAATRALQMSFRELSDAVRQGAHLYQRSASVGMNPARVASLQKMFEGIGLSPDLALRMITQARMGGRSASLFTDVNGMAMRAQLSGASVEEIQQIKNLGNELRWLADQTKFAAIVLGDTSKSMQEISMHTLAMKTEWSALWSQLGELFEPTINFFESLATWLMRIEIIALRVFKEFPLGDYFGFNAAEKWAKVFAGSDKGPGKNLYATGLSHNTPEGQFARIGFTFGNFGGGDYIRQTAQNTKRIADAVTRGSSGRGGWSDPMFLPSHNIP